MYMGKKKHKELDITTLGSAVMMRMPHLTLI